MLDLEAMLGYIDIVARLAASMLLKLRLKITFWIVSLIAMR